MYRYAIEELFKWKEKPNRKPMIIQGVRHVGKTWLMNYEQWLVILLLKHI